MSKRRLEILKERKRGRMNLECLHEIGFELYFDVYEPKEQKNTKDVLALGREREKERGRDDCCVDEMRLSCNSQRKKKEQTDQTHWHSSDTFQLERTQLEQCLFYSFLYVKKRNFFLHFFLALPYNGTL